MRTTSAERVGLAIVRVWLEEDPTCSLRARVTTIDDVAVPFKEVARGLRVRKHWRGDRAPVEGVIGLAVGVGVAQRGADRKAQIWPNRHEPEVEQPVNVAAQGQAVEELMAAAVLPWPDVRGVEHRQRVLVGDRAGAVVGVEHGEAEARLPESRRDELGLAVPAKLDRLGRPFGQMVSLSCLLQASGPESKPFALRKVV